MKIAIHTALAGVLLLGGCAGTPFGNQLHINEAGQEGPAPTFHKQLVTEVLKSRLKDPYSAVIDVGEPVKGSCSVGIYGRHYGWRVPVDYNAKNGFGAYVGTKREYWWFNGEEFTKLSDTPNGLCF